MNRKFLSLSALILLNSCLLHYITPTNARVQLVNKSNYTITNLNIVSKSSTMPPITIVQDTLLPDSISWVSTTDMTGEFNMSIDIIDLQPCSLSCSNTIDIGRITIESGSVRFRFVWPEDGLPSLQKE